MRLQIEATEKILGKSFTFEVRSVENCCKKGTSKNLTTPTLHTPKLSLMIAYDYIQIYSEDTFSGLNAPKCIGIIGFTLKGTPF